MDIVGDAIAAIDRDGYAIIRHLVTGDRLRRLQQDAEALLIPIEAKGVVGGSITGGMHKGTFGVSRAFDDIIIPDFRMRSGGTYPRHCAPLCNLGYSGMTKPGMTACIAKREDRVIYRLTSRNPHGAAESSYQYGVRNGQAPAGANHKRALSTDDISIFDLKTLHWSGENA